MSNVLETCPEEQRERYAKRAEKIGKSLRAAIDLKCLECCAWQVSVVRHCHITSCALHAARPFQSKGEE